MKNRTLLTQTDHKLSEYRIICILTCIVFLAPFFRNQIITGTLVNAALFTSALLLRNYTGIILCAIPSPIALIAGTLPVSLAPMIPAIILSNILLLFSFSFLKKAGYWMAVITSGLIKFSMLYAVSYLVMQFSMQSNLNYNVLLMLQWPQFLTTISGGILTQLWLGYYK